MSTVLTGPTTTPAVARGSLLRAESLRFWSRRTVRVVLALGLLGFLAGIVVASTQFARPSAAGLAAAEANRLSFAAEQDRYRAECVAAVGTPSGPPTATDCGPPARPEELGALSDFLDKPAFTLDQDAPAGVVSVSVAVSTAMFLLGASYVGAEWSSRSMVALLTWEPRRRRVMATKLAVLSGVAAVVGTVAQGLWLAAARVLAETRGTTRAPGPAWADLAASAGRGVLLAVLVALLGFGVANLLRNTAAALGVGFVYFVIVENVVRAFRPAWGQWLLTDNAIALLLHGGTTVYTNEGFVDEQGAFQSTGRDIALGNLHGGLVLSVATAVVVGAGIALFARRDLE